MKKLLIILGLGVAALGATFIQNSNVIDDTDLAGPAPFRASKVSSSIQPDHILRREAFKGDGLRLQFLYMRNAAWMGLSNLNVAVGKDNLTTDKDGVIEIESCSGNQNVQISLATPKFQIQNPNGQAYSLSFSAECSGDYEIQFDEKSTSGEAMSIYETLSRAEMKLMQALGKDIWNKRLPVIWPADADYYNFSRLNISLGYQWDVVGHELGHAIYDMGRLGGWGGGQHKIDECYSDGMAISEGWATFFSSWLYNDLADTDAKFQYLVPRRAPIRIEHVPEDVCNAPQSEWRVSSFLWDLVDSNDDGESVDALFAVTWNAMENSSVGSISKARTLFERAGISKEKVDQAWNNNFKSKNK